MVEFKWIKMSLFLIAELQFTAAAGKLPLSFTVRDGDEVTLPCENVIDGQQKCNYTTWIFNGRGSSPTVELVNLGQKKDKSKSDRLSVTENCSLVIKKVTVEDVGRYTCRQFISGQQEGEDSQVHLSVIDIDQPQNDDVFILFCYVLTYGDCGHTVKWLYEGNNNNMEISGSGPCSVMVTFTPPDLNQKSNYLELLKCNVTDNQSGHMLLCDVGPQSSCEKTGGTLEERNKTSPADDETTTTPGNTLEGENKTLSAEDETTTTKQGWWWSIIILVGVAALLIIVVVVIRQKRTKGKKTQTDENTAGPEDGVSYAYISYNSNSEARVRGKDEDETVNYSTVGDPYSTVGAPSSSAGASADPSHLYATID